MCPETGQNKLAQIGIQKMMLNARKMHFTARMVKHWHKFSREVVESPLFDILRLDKLLRNQFQAALLEQGFGLDDLQKPLPTSTLL